MNDSLTDLPHQPAIEAMLEQWLPTQRWFAGKDAGAPTVRVTVHRVLQAGDPALLHLLIDVAQGSATSTSAPQQAATYQLLVGTRRVLPQVLEHAVIGHVDDMFLYDAMHDHDLMGALLEWIDDDQTRDGIVFRHLPDAKIDRAAASLVLGGEQSNSSVVFGEQSIMKLFRIVVPGLNPDLEVTRALTQSGSPHIAALQGWIETDIGGTTSTLGVLQEFLRTGSDGWALALTSVRDLFAEGDLHADEVGGDFAAESERLGLATADVHTAMAEALPTAVAGEAALAELANSMRHRLDAATVAVPALAVHAPKIAAAFDVLASGHGPLQLQRVHGDLHLGQVLRTDAGWVLLDFEGEPGAPMHTRTALSSPLRDVAAMLRSFDYAARYLLADSDMEHRDKHLGVPQGPGQLDYRAGEWSERNRDAFCNGYAKGSGRDPRDDEALLRAFELDKAVYEVVYETRNRPSWVRIPLGSIERLVAA
ncbi:MAG TPA: aminoglycoside phosphotransferase [Acidothermaceae bacterium]